MESIINFIGENIQMIYILVLSIFVGVEVIGHVPSVLHTPLMSAANAISGITLVGSIVTAGGKFGMIPTILGFIAVACAMTNVVGGFLITDRMLGMFKHREKDSRAGTHGGAP